MSDIDENPAVEGHLFNYKYVKGRGEYQAIISFPLAWDEKVRNRLGRPDDDNPPRVAVVRLNNETP